MLRVLMNVSNHLVDEYLALLLYEATDLTVTGNVDGES